MTAVPPDLPRYRDDEIDHIIRYRICARCYGHLLKDVDRSAPIERRWLALCPVCGDAWHGAHISRLYYEKLLARGKSEYWEVVCNPDLKDILPTRPKPDPAQLLKELGYKEA